MMESCREFVTAAFEGDLEKVKSYVEKGCEVNTMGQNWNPLHAAIENEHVEIVEFLLKSGARVDLVNQNMTPLAHAVDIAIDGTIQSGGKVGDEPVELINLLIEYGADISPSLKIAQAYHNDTLTKYLQKKCAEYSANSLQEIARDTLEKGNLLEHCVNNNAEITRGEGMSHDKIVE